MENCYEYYQQINSSIKEKSLIKDNVCRERCIYF